MSTAPPQGPREPTPRWVKSFVMIAIALVIGFAVAHLTCGGLHGHG